METRTRSAIRWLTAGAGLAASGYALRVAWAWARFGHARRPAPAEEDALLERFMPSYEVVERFHIRVATSADATFAAARNMDLFGMPVVRVIFRARERILRASPYERPRPRGLLEEAQSIGWGILAEVPGREVVMGGVTKPWEPNPVFRALPPAEYAAFREPGYVKIAWTLRADPIGAGESVFRHETRVTATDAASRARFRTYWSFVSPGIILIRWVALAAVRNDALRIAASREGIGAAPGSDVHPASPPTP